MSLGFRKLISVLVLLSLGVMLGLLVPKVSADIQIELEGFSVREGVLDFYMDLFTSVPLRNKALLALNIWNSAMRWYVEGYTHDKFSPLFLHLVENKEEAKVLINFFINEQTNVAGYAKSVPDADGYLQWAEVHINLPPSVAADESEIRTVAVLVHEIGHVLGLGHTDLEEDIMYSTYDQNAPNYGLPSTLDLEAVYRLLKREVDPSRAFQTSTLWGIPNWVRQISNGYELTIPEYPILTDIGVGYPPTINATNQIVRVPLPVEIINYGNVPIKLVSFTIIVHAENYSITDSLKQEEPKLLMPSERYPMTWRFEIGQLGVGQFSADIEYKYLVPEIVGWNERCEIMKHAIAISIVSWEATITFATQYVGTTFSETFASETKFDYWLIVLLVAPVVMIGIVLVIWSKKTQPRSRVTSVRPQL